MCNVGCKQCTDTRNKTATLCSTTANLFIFSTPSYLTLGQIPSFYYYVSNTKSITVLITWLIWDNTVMFLMLDSQFLLQICTKSTEIIVHGIVHAVVLCRPVLHKLFEP